MEAWRFGFDRTLFPSAYKFDPTDADIVAHYLLPRALDVPNPPLGHAIVDGDPYSCPPWELMRRAGHAGSDHAFFFPPPRLPGQQRAARGVLGGAGKWDLQKSPTHSVALLRGGGGNGGGSCEVVVTYKVSNLSYYHGDERSTSGWVMHEYEIVVPRWLSGVVLSRVRVTDKAKQRLKKAAAAAAAAGGGGHGRGKQQVGVVVPGPDEPGPSNYGGGGGFVHGGRDNDHDGNDALGGSSSGEQSDEVVACLGDGDGDGSAMAEMAAYFVDDGNSYLNDDGSGYY